jgi:hypothetical protein
MDCTERSKDLQITLVVGNSLTSGVTGSFIKGNCTVWGLSCVCVCVCECMGEMWNSAENSKPDFLLHRLLSVSNLVLLILYICNASL